MKINIAVILSVVILSSCSQRVFFGNKKQDELAAMSRFIFQDMERVALEYPDTILRIHPDLKFRKNLTKKSWRTGMVYNYGAIDMKWSCVLNEQPDTTIVLPLPELPKELRSRFIVSRAIDRDRTIHIPSIFYSPVFETKELGVYAFHRSMVYNLAAEFDYMEATLRIFQLFRIDDDGAVIWLDCCGNSFYPFE